MAPWMWYIAGLLTAPVVSLVAIAVLMAQDKHRWGDWTPDWTPDWRDGDD